MEPQYVAGHSSSNQGNEASESQHAVMPACGYLFSPDWRKLQSRFTQVAYTSRGTGFRDSPVDLTRNCDRRLRCPRASNCSPYSVLRSQHPLARVKHRLKSSLWLIPRRSPLSQYTQVSTSNLPTGQASAPASSFSKSSIVRQIGGASWL